MGQNTLSIRDAMQEVRDGHVYLRGDREGPYVHWVLSAYAENPWRAVALGRGRPAIVGDPGKQARTLAGLRRAGAAIRDKVLDELYVLEIDEEIAAA